MNTIEQRLSFAFVTTNLKGGGAELALIKLATGLRSRGHDVYLILLENIVDHELDGAVPLFFLTEKDRPARKGVFGKYWLAWKLRGLVRRLSIKKSFDVVVSTLPFADEVVSLARLSNVWFRIANTLSAEIRLLEEQNESKARRRLRRYQRVYGRKNLIAVSQGVAADLKANLRLAPANLVTIYNLYDFGKIRRMAEQASRDLPPFPYVIHVGRFIKQKRHDLLFAAWKQAALPHKLVLLANPTPELENMIRNYGLENDIVVAGFQRNPYPWIKNAALLVLCSDHEGLPNVLVEALVCGTRVVSTDCPSGPNEILTGSLRENLVPLNDPQSLAATMRRALDSAFEVPGDFNAKFNSENVLRRYEALGGSDHQESLV